MLQRNSVINVGIYNKNTAIAMSVITFSILGTVFLYRVCAPLSKYRKVVLICSASVNIVSLLITGVVSHLTHTTEPILRIPYVDMGGPAYFVMFLIIVLYATIYLFVYRLISINKGESSNEN